MENSRPEGKKNEQYTNKRIQIFDMKKESLWMT